MSSSIKSKVKSFEWKTRRENNRVSKDGPFTNETIEGCTYHLEKNDKLLRDNVTYVALEIYIDGANEPIISNPLTITALSVW